jgi:hypothetical protein
MIQRIVWAYGVMDIIGAPLSSSFHVILLHEEVARKDLSGRFIRDQREDTRNGVSCWSGFFSASSVSYVLLHISRIAYYCSAPV